jgi:hypothetical protein
MLGGKYWSVFKDNGLAVYNPRLLTLTIADQLVTGFADNVCTISYVADNITPVKGIEGNTALLRQTTRDATISFSLLQTSETNKWLLQMQADMLDGTKPIQLPQATFTDYNLLVSWTAQSAFIQKHPDMTYNATAGSTTWQLYCIGCTPRQNIKLDDSILTNEQILFRKVGEAVKSVGKTISSVFS